MSWVEPRPSHSVSVVHVVRGPQRKQRRGPRRQWQVDESGCSRSVRSGRWLATETLRVDHNSAENNSPGVRFIHGTNVSWKQFQTGKIMIFNSQSRNRLLVWEGTLGKPGI